MWSRQGLGWRLGGGGDSGLVHVEANPRLEGQVRGKQRKRRDKEKWGGRHKQGRGGEKGQILSSRRRDCMCLGIADEYESCEVFGRRVVAYDSVFPIS